MANHHLIEKHIFNIEVNTSKNVYAIQQKVSEMVWKDLVTELSKLFDSMVSENEVMRFDTLELDLGNISFNEADTEKIVEKIIVLLKEEIIKKKQHLQSASNVGESVWNINSQKTKSEHYFEIWLYWLRKGMLPSYTVPPQNNWMELVLEVLALNSNAVLALENTIKKHPIALERLILQHAPKDLKSITELYTGFSQSGLLVFFKELESIYKTITITGKVSYRKFEIALWKEVLKQVISERKKTNTIEICINLMSLPEFNWVIIECIKIATPKKKQYPFLQNIFEENPQTQFIINNVLSKPIDVNKLPESDSLNNINRKVADTIETNQLSESDSLNDMNRKVIDTIETNQLSESDSLNDMNRKVADTIETKQLSESNSLNNMNRKVADAIETGVPCFFKNAGVVLIHPFLSHLFRKLNLLETNEFKDFESQSKAVLLIHYLATENEHPLEYEMVLPKFLCSMPVNMPIDHTLLITEEEKMEINNVLQAAIEHWGALGNVTPDSLREGFLMREGKLEKEETGWKLHVEQKTLDVLLDKLPWNLSIIKLPWMKDLLKVEWR